MLKKPYEKKKMPWRQRGEETGQVVRDLLGHPEDLALTEGAGSHSRALNGAVARPNKSNEGPQAVHGEQTTGGKDESRGGSGQFPRVGPRASYPQCLHFSHL